jgi:hypothetical protein
MDIRPFSMGITTEQSNIIAIKEGASLQLTGIKVVRSNELSTVYSLKLLFDPLKSICEILLWHNLKCTFEIGCVVPMLF